MVTGQGGHATPLAVRIRDLRRSAGLTQQELADHAAVSVAAIRDLEQGRVTFPHPEHRARLARALGVDPADWKPRRGKQGGLRIDVLGPLSISSGGVPLRPPPAGQRAVLGLLTLAQNAPVSVNSIITALWGQQPPGSAANIVLSYVSRIRGMLDGGAERSRIRRQAGGYSLRLADGECDLAVFRHLVDDARTAADPATARDAFKNALSLWRGEPLADIAQLREHPAVMAIREEFAAAVLDFADAAADGGYHHDVLPQLRALAARDPLDESALSRLMIALAATGRQAEALAAYEDLRQRLNEQLGVLPGSAVRDAHTRILGQQVDAAAPRSPERWLPLFQLPAAPADFTGRVKESTILASVLTPRPAQPGVPLVVVSGPPGVGKTALTLQVAHTLRAQFPDGQLWVHLAGTSAHPRDPAEVLGEFLRALGMHGSAIPDLFSERAVCYRARLADRRVLVVADDAATADQVRPLLPGTPGCALVVTSRSRLEDLDGGHPMPLDMLPVPDAAELLTRLAGEERVLAEPDAVDGLVRACGGLPLALRIAGAKLAARPTWTLSLLAHRMTGTRARLRELETGDLSVRASIGSSYDSLPDRLRSAFRLLALVGPADFAEWVVGALLGDPEGTDVLDALVSRSLVMPLGADATGEARYRLHDLVRDFAADRLAKEVDAGDRDVALARLLDGWLQLAVLADAQLPPEPYFPPPPKDRPAVVLSEALAVRLTADAMTWFSAERVNLLTAVDQACRAGNLTLAHKLAAHQCAYQHLQYRQDDAERLWRFVESAATQAGDAVLLTYASLRIAASLSERGSVIEARPIVDRCVEEADRLGELETLSYALEWRATCAWDQDDLAGARGNAERGVAIARLAGLPAAEQRNLGQLATSLAYFGQPEQALAAVERALQIATGLGVPAYELAALLSAAHTYFVMGSHDSAVASSLRALEISRSLGDVCSEALASGMLGDAYYGLGRYQDAVSSLLRALSVFRDQSSRHFHATCLLKLGYAYEALGSADAVGCVEEALRIFGQLGLAHKVDTAQRALDRLRPCDLTS